MKFQQKVKQSVKKTVLSLTRPLGIEISKVANNRNVLGYVSAKETIHAASQSNLSVPDYLDKIWNHKDNRELIINQLQKFGILNQTIQNICEIGTGAGRYVEQTIHLCQPACYESYEPDQDWAKWLTEKYKIISQPSDGQSLSYTSDSSIDLVTAHGVFIYLPFLIIYRYLLEIVRVTKNSGYVVFDIFTEDCLDDEKVKYWLDSDYDYPCFFGEIYAINFFTKREFIFVGSFFSKDGTKYLIFQKN